MPSLSFANLLAATFERIGPETDAVGWAVWIDLLAATADEINLSDILRDINEDRAISGFPEVQTLGDIETAVINRKRYYKDAIRSAIDRLPTGKLVEVITDVVEAATENGEIHACSLIDKIVDSYEIEAQSFLNQESDNIEKLVEVARVTASRGLHDRIPSLLNTDFRGTISPNCHHPLIYA